MRYRLTVVAGLAVVALSACGQQQSVDGNRAVETSRSETGEGRARYSLSEDAAGDYAPLETVQAGEWTLEHIFIAGPHSFESWISGDAVQPAQAPVMLVFRGANGGLTLAPARFDISDRRISFDGKAPATGDYRFEGRLDLDALANARRTLGSKEVVLKGKLEIGGRTFNNLSFQIKTGG